MRDLHESCRRTIAASSFPAWAANLIARKTTGKSCDYRERERHDDDEARHSLGIASKQVWRYLSGTTVAVTAALFNIVPRQDPSPPLCLPRSISLPAAEVTRGRTASIFITEERDEMD